MREGQPEIEEPKEELIDFACENCRKMRQSINALVLSHNDLLDMKNSLESKLYALNLAMAEQNLRMAELLGRNEDEPQEGKRAL